MRNKIRDIMWIVIVSISFFILTGAVWIRKTYGILSIAMADEGFVNYLVNKRTVFLKYTILPTAVVFIILLIIQKCFGERGIFSHKKILTSAAVFLFIASCCVAENRLGISSYIARQHRLNENQWYDADRVIVHALGEIDDITYSNSKEAMENSYCNGKKLLECDLIMTSDNQVVACHDWEIWNSWNDNTGVETGDETAIPTFDEFMSTKIMGRYTALSGEDLIIYMKEHPDVYIITDTKEADPDVLGEPFTALVNLALENDCEDVLDRFVVQIYHGYMYGVINDIYPFSNYIFTLYQEGYRGSKDKIKEYASFCASNNVDVITMNVQYYNDELLDICNRYGVQIFVHTVNDEKEIKTLLEKGVGVYTDITDI